VRTENHNGGLGDAGGDEAHDAASEAETKRHRRAFVVALLVIATVALGVRVTFVMTRGTDRSLYDAAFYQGEAELLADGKGFVDPLLYRSEGRIGQAAQHPPLTALVLTPVAMFSDGDTPMRLTFCVVGAIGVFLIGLLGAELSGRRTGLIAAGIATVYPLLWVNDGVVMAESLAITLTVAALLVMYRLLRAPRVGLAVGAGVLCGLAALARAELLLLGGFLAVGIIVRLRGPAFRQRAVLAGALLTAMVVVVAPWVGYNLSRFERPVLMTTDGDVNLMFSTCQSTFYGPDIGGPHYFCLVPLPPGAADHSVEAEYFRKIALRYTRAHALRYPVVVAARLGRIWSVFQPGDAIVNFEGRPSWVMGLGLAFYYPLLALAFVGAGILHRRRRAWWLLMIPPVLTVAIALVSWGQTRYRAVAEPTIVLLAAVAIGALVDHVGRTRIRTRSPAVDGAAAAAVAPVVSPSSGSNR